MRVPRCGHPLDPAAFQETVALTAPEDGAAKETGGPEGCLDQVTDGKQREPAARGGALQLDDGHAPRGDQSDRESRADECPGRLSCPSRSGIFIAKARKGRKREEG